ncbi:MAG TPA: haloacid dehalogenase [Acidimicrobiia bacterium]
MTPGLPDEVRSLLDSRFAARELAISESRQVVRSSANAIRALHRSDTVNADELISGAGAKLVNITTTLQGHPELLGHAVVDDAAKEYAEACITRAVFAGEPIPGFADLGVDPIPYLHGLGEAVGEMRRRLLDLLRAERLDDAERLLVEMDDIVDLLAEVDYPDGMTNGLRRTTDVARALVERSRSDLTATVVQDRLRRDLKG